MSSLRIGHGYDVHVLSDNIPFILGGVKLHHSKGCVAHSDGDVAIHAMCDAILGAVALGDIGKHFPDTNNSYKNIDSTILLSKCIELLHSKGYEIVNIDVTIVLQSPKIEPYIAKMRDVLSKILKIDIDQISVKATTTEKLGFVGREEGVEAHCIVLVSK